MAHLAPIGLFQIIGPRLGRHLQFRRITQLSYTNLCAPLVMCGDNRLAVNHTSAGVRRAQHQG